MTTWTKVTDDFDFLNGFYDVRHRTLKKAFADCDEWQEYDGTTTARTHFDGQISIDEMRFPTKGSYGLSVRVFDPEAREWSIWWVNSTTLKLYPPVRGTWTEDGTRCRMVGEDELDGKPILSSYEWSDITDTTAHWEQAYSNDGGATWETNWTMDFTRRSTPPPPLDVPKVTDDFDFLVGRWSFQYRRRRPVLGHPATWHTFDATMEVHSYFDGAISFDEGWFPSEGFRGATLRLYNPESKTWNIHWVNSTRGRLETPVTGSFESGTGIFEGPDEWNDIPIDVRFEWTPGKNNAAWTQSFSVDGGTTWVPNWHMKHTRVK